MDHKMFSLMTDKEKVEYMLKNGSNHKFYYKNNDWYRENPLVFFEVISTIGEDDTLITVVTVPLEISIDTSKIKDQNSVKNGLDIKISSLDQYLKDYPFLQDFYDKAYNDLYQDVLKDCIESYNKHDLERIAKNLKNSSIANNYRFKS